MRDLRGCSQWKCLFWEYWYLNKTTPRAIWYKCCSRCRWMASKLDMDLAALRLFQDDHGPHVGLSHKFWGCLRAIVWNNFPLPSTEDKSPCWKPKRSARYPKLVAWRVSSLCGLQNTSRTCSLDPWDISVCLNAFWNSLDSCWTNSWNCFWYWETCVTLQQTSSLSKSPAFRSPMAHIESLIVDSSAGRESRSQLPPGDSCASAGQWCSRTPWHSGSMSAGSASLARHPPRRRSLPPSGLAGSLALAWVEGLASVKALLSPPFRISRSWETRSAAVSGGRPSVMSRTCAQTIGATWLPDSRSRHMDGPNVPFWRWWVTIPSLPVRASWTSPTPRGLPWSSWDGTGARTGSCWQCGADGDRSTGFSDPGCETWTSLAFSWGITFLVTACFSTVLSWSWTLWTFRLTSFAWLSEGETCIDGCSEKLVCGWKCVFLFDCSIMAGFSGLACELKLTGLTPVSWTDFASSVSCIKVSAEGSVVLDDKASSFISTRKRPLPFRLRFTGFCRNGLIRTFWETSTCAFKVRSNDWKATKEYPLVLQQS